jgi:hypothetical protein
VHQLMVEARRHDSNPSLRSLVDMYIIISKKSTIDTRFPIISFFFFFAPVNTNAGVVRHETLPSLCSNARASFSCQGSPGLRGSLLGRPNLYIIEDRPDLSPLTNNKSISTILLQILNWLVVSPLSDRQAR